MKRSTIAIVCNNFEINQKSGYNTAMELYDVMSEKYKIKIIIPLDADIYEDTEKWINPHMSVVSISPSPEFTRKMHGLKIPLYFNKHAHEDAVISNKLICATQDADIVICNALYFVGFVRRVLPHKTLVLRSLDVEYDKICQMFEHTPLALNETLEKRDLVKSSIFDLEKLAYDSADYVLTLTKNDEERFVQLYNMDVNKIIRVPICFRNAARYNGFIPERKERKGDRVNILFISYLFYDPERIVRKIEMIASEIPNVTFHIVGSVGSALNIKTLPENIVVYGVVDDAKRQEISGLCDCALNIPTQTYGMNVKMMEYFAAGLPVLTNKFGTRGYDIKEYSEYIPAEYGSLIDDIRAFANMDTEKRYQIALNAFRYICQSHKYETYLEKMEEKIGINHKYEVQDNGLMNTRIYIFGAGVAGEKCLRELLRRGCNCLGFLDNSSKMQGKCRLGFEIFSPYPILSDIGTKKDLILVIATDIPIFLAEIYKQVSQILPHNRIRIYFQGTFDSEKIDINKLLNM